MGNRWTAGFLGVALACTVAAAMTVEERALLRGRVAASALSDTLREKLSESLKSGGTTGTMKVCSYQAQALTREVAEKQGVRVRRTSLRLRNPRNAPDAWEREVLLRLQELAIEGKLPDEVFEAAEAEGKKVFRYAKPLNIGPVCIGCHGSDSEVSEEVRGLLRERYPLDQALGYRRGELRGIASVIVPAE